MAHGYEELLTESNQEVKRTKIVQSEPDPAVVFFPTNQDSECMDATTGIVKTKTIIIFFSYHMKEWKPISVASLTQNAWMQILENPLP